jgi:hypothetical protein
MEVVRMLNQPDITNTFLLRAALIGTLFLVACSTNNSSNNSSNNGNSSQDPAYTTGGTVSRLVGAGLVLQNNGGNNLTVSANGSFNFTTGLATGAAYSVTVLTQPSNPTQVCTVTNGSGTVASAAITNVAVNCLTTTTSAMVPDFGNNRVLIYTVPLGAVFDETASTVLGQPGFTTATAGTTASTMNQPTAVAVDAKGNVYVVDSANCRVTQFVSPITSGMNASVVFGQPNFTTSTCPASTSATSATSLYGPYGATVDHAGDLWVDDYESSRIVEYVPPFSNGMSAALAIGQPNLTSGSATQATTSAALSLPGFPIFDPSGNLWVADYNNSRVLEYKPPFSTGMAASLVLGQGNFTNNSEAVGATGMDGPWAVAFDASGNLWMADYDNNRVLEFVPPFTNDMAATLVLGQPDFVHNSSNDGFTTPTAATLSNPLQVAFSSNGDLWVNDSGNNRTLVFAPPFTNGMNATDVIGQPSFSADLPNQGLTAPTSATQNNPQGVITGPPLY